MASAFQEIDISHLLGDRQMVSELKKLFRDKCVKLVSGSDWELLLEYHNEAREQHGQLIQLKAQKKALEERNKESARIVAALKSIATTAGFPMMEGEDNLSDNYLTGLITHITRLKETDVSNCRPPENPQTSAEAVRNVSSPGGGISQIIGMGPAPEVSLRSSSAPVFGIGNRYAATNQDNQRGRGTTMAPTVVPDPDIKVLSHTKLVELNRIKTETNPEVIRTPPPPCFVIPNQCEVNNQQTQVDHDTTAAASSSPIHAAEVDATHTAESSHVLSAPSTVRDGITNQSSVRQKQGSGQSTLPQKAAPKSVKLQRQAKGCNSSKMEPNKRAYNGAGRNFKGKHAALSLENPRNSMKPWQCTCGCCYKRKCELQVHLAQYNIDKKFKCDIGGCEKKFAFLGNLNEHLRVTHRVRTKPFSKFGCRFCGKYFQNRGARNTHRLKRCYDKAENKSLDTSQLPEAVLRLDRVTLPQHGRAPGTSSRPHRCLCGLTFGSNDLLEAHIGYP